ncbi:MAG TPA: DUF899 family protein [Acidimicrobiales bacterium]|nr:DUF899 family protein [Acidimicrobiales bacterium]
MVSMPQVVSMDEWQRERAALLVAEKEVTRRLDAMAAQRRRLPMVRFDNEKYLFETTDGPKRLSDFFEERQQLAVYQFMDNGPDAFCPGCTHFTDNVTDLVTLNEGGVSWRTVSNMPLGQMETYWASRSWTVPFASSRGTSFAIDCGADAGFMLNIFFKYGQDVYRTYATTARGVDRLLFVNNILDLSPYGRQEDWEDSPAGWPQHPTYG